jgi:hypothetical protein
LSHLLGTVVGGIGTLVLLGGCCTTRHCDLDRLDGQFPVFQPLESHISSAAVDQYGHAVQDAITALIRKTSTKPMLEGEAATPLRVLLLSGGGPKGAYGAGFLNGLKDLSPNAADRLDYDIVTGVSTGSIQATFAFLGPDYYGRMADFYTIEDWDEAVPKRPLWSLVFCGDSLRSTDGFRRKLEEYLTDDLIDKVAERGGDGTRMLLVGTVNLDSGYFQRWDMVAIAKSKDYELYRDVILASSSVPIVFPPVPLVRQSNGANATALHVDGGTRHMAFLRQSVLDVVGAAGEYSRGVESSVDLIINDSLSLNRVCMQDNLVDIAKRSVMALVKQSIENDVFRTYAIACGNNVPLRVTYLDTDVGHLDDDFYPGMREDMQRVFQEAYQKAREHGWDLLPGSIENREDIKLLCNGWHGQ